MNDVQKKDFVNSCPSKVYKFDETSKKVIADIEDLAVFNCTFCQGIFMTTLHPFYFFPYFFQF